MLARFDITLPHWFRSVRQGSAKLLRDESGAIYTEYITLVILVTLVAAIAIVTLGVPLMRQYEMAKLLLVAPIP